MLTNDPCTTTWQLYLCIPEVSTYIDKACIDVVGATNSGRHLQMDSVVVIWMVKLD